ncbi:hypothetical protein [Sphingomonas sp. NFR15]|nr:hypothetical protein [Sphingomonas sp. NFR15]SDA14882.1 hypothetical protein SAMN03159340_00608 [Sphingomonas sp. NFR15]
MRRYLWGGFTILSVMVLLPIALILLPFYVWDQGKDSSRLYDLY